MSEDWKGEDKIRISREERMLTTRSVASAMDHKRRQKQGVNMSKAGGQWAREITAWHLEAIDVRGKR